MRLPLIPKHTWKRPDKLSYLSIIISVVALSASIILSIFGYKSQSRYNELQNTLLLIEHAPYLEYRNFSIFTLFGDNEPYLFVELKNTGKIAAKAFQVEGAEPESRLHYKRSNHVFFYAQSYSVRPDNEVTMPLAPLREIKEDFAKKYPAYAFLRIVDDMNYLSPAHNAKAFHELGIPDPKNGEMQSLELFPIEIDVTYSSALDHNNTLHLYFFIVAQKTL